MDFFYNSKYFFLFNMGFDRVVLFVLMDIPHF